MLHTIRWEMLTWPLVDSDSSLALVLGLALPGSPEGVVLAAAIAGVRVVVALLGVMASISLCRLVPIWVPLPLHPHASP